MSQILQDFLFSLRRLRRRPLHVFFTVGILTLGLTATVAVVTYVNGFYQPFPGVDARGLYRLFDSSEENPFLNLSYLDFKDYAAQATSFEGITASQGFYAASVRREEETEVAFLEVVSGNFFSVIGAPLLHGRGIQPDDDLPGAPAAAVLSHAWWTRSFAASPAVIGQTLYLNYRPFTIVGVAAAEFLGTPAAFRPDVWIPFQPFSERYVSWTAQSEKREVPLVRVYARVAEGASARRAQLELEGLAGALDEAYPRPDGPRKMRLEKATWIDPNSRLAEMPTIRLMILAVSILLLLVCANTSNLLLALARERDREICVRAVLGASPGRLLRLVLVETALLTLASGAIAFALAGPTAGRLGSYFARPSVWGANVARVVSVDSRVFWWAFSITALVGLLIGCMPALRAARGDLMLSLRTQGSASNSLRRRLLGWRLPELQSTLVGCQVTLTVVLLVVAGLVLRTLVHVSRLDPGFEFDRLVVTHVSTSSTDLTPEQRDLFFRNMARDLAGEAWAKTATVADFPPLSPHASLRLRLEGQPEEISLVHSKVIPGFFQALGIPILQGREFGPLDVMGGRPVAIVNQLLADRYFPPNQAPGRKIWWPGTDGTQREFTIVGVAANTRTQDYLAAPEPVVYFSYPQHAYPTGSALLVSTRQDPRSTIQPLHQWLRAYEPHLAIINVISYPDVVRGFLYTHRMNAEMFSALGFLGIALTASGIFSLTALAVSRRRREIGIRMSLGAQRRQIGVLMLRQGLLPVLLGLGIGLVTAIPVAEQAGSLLEGVSPTDPATLFGGLGIIILAALAAAILPTLRATHVDPSRALREE